MRTRHAPGTYGSALLDRQLRALRRSGPDGPGNAALRARSADARVLLEHAGDDPWAVGELARVIACQDLEPEDRATGLALLDDLLRTHGPDAIAPEHQGLHAQLAFPAGRAAELLDRYPRIPRQVREALGVDLAEPSLWPARFNELLPGPGITIADGTGPRFERIVPGTVEPVDGTLVTTVVTTYRPGPALLVTIRSLIAQSWTAQEILIVDDGSGDSAVLDEVSGLDPRIRVLRLPINGGTYVARNAALDAATGEFVTFQDSDDWSHPLRLERQVRPLLADPALFATTSAGMRVTGDLVVTRPGYPWHRTYNLSSLMLRREVALTKLGYLDTVRKGADAEYVERARAVFGRPAVQHLAGETLALIRLSGGSLSSADLAAGWMHPARQAYLSAFQAWHVRVAAGRESAHRPRTPSQRVFAAPRCLTDSPDPSSFDLIVAGDLTVAESAGPVHALLGSHLAVLHLPALGNAARNLDPDVQHLINTGAVEQVVLTDQVHTKLLVVRGPEPLAFAPSLPSGIRADRVVIEEEAPWATDRLFGTVPVVVPLPRTVDARRWRTLRTEPSADRPILGRFTTEAPVDLLGVLKNSADFDVRLLDRTAVTPRRPPLNWLIYQEADVSARSFLHQLDFYVGLDDPAGDLLPALAAGCVLLLPPERAPEFGPAAVYCTTADLHRTVRRLHRAPARWSAQSARGRDFARRHPHAEYARAVLDLLPRPAPIPHPRSARPQP
jgi:O-antigen biosynthesis protein